MMIKSIKIKDEMLGKSITLFIGPYENAMKFGKKKFPKWDWTDEQGGSTALTIGFLTQNDWFIWLPKWEANTTDIGKLSHELLHVSMRILQSCGISITQDEHEVLCYLHSYYMREFLVKLFSSKRNK